MLRALLLEVPEEDLQEAGSKVASAVASFALEVGEHVTASLTCTRYPHSACSAGRTPSPPV